MAYEEETPYVGVHRAPAPLPTQECPDLESLMELDDGESTTLATDGCWVEPDGECDHGHPSWLVELGLI